jgi:hypothetical protein
VIAVAGDAVACLGGWRGDGLFVSRSLGPLSRVADLGWDAREQVTPQRRLEIARGELFVLEPVHGYLLLPPLRVRRFDLAGRELGREEGEGVRGAALLSFHARRLGGDRSRVTRCGIDPASGRPTVEEEEVAADLPGRLPETSGIPLFANGVFHYPVRMRGLFRGPEQLFRGDPGLAQVVRGEVVCAGNRRGRPGILRSGEWSPLPGPRLFPPWRAPLGPLVAPHGEGLLVLRREGSALPALDAPPASLPPSIYSALFPLSGRLFAIEEGEIPRLVPVATL